MSRIIRVIIQNSSYQNKNREEVNNREIRYLPDLSIFNFLSYNEGDPYLCIRNSVKSLLLFNFHLQEFSALIYNLCAIIKNFRILKNLIILIHFSRWFLVLPNFFIYFVTTNFMVTYALIEFQHSEFSFEKIT